MTYITAIVAVVPIRAEASHQSEMVSQLLFGELGEITEGNPQLVSGSFVKIKSKLDGYEGWCQSAQLARVPEELANQYTSAITADYLNLIEVNGTNMQLPFGVSLGLFRNQQLKLEGYQFAYHGQLTHPENNLVTAEKIKGIASLFLNTPYLWGGRSLFGIDCSGFVQQVYRYFNIVLPRDAYQQAEIGSDIAFLAESKCGDLAFFDNPAGRITHVGILLSESQIIHASGKVRVDSIDQAGILNTDTGERTHSLRLIKRYSGE